MNNLSMRKMNQLSKKKKKGFTLVELIIVIAIIAILVAIAIPKFGQITTNANKKADIATAKNLHGVAAQMIAEGNIKSGDGDVTTKVEGNIDGGATSVGNTKLDKSKAFFVNVSATGDITVHSGSLTGDQVYPATSSGAYSS